MSDQKSPRDITPDSILLPNGTEILLARPSAADQLSITVIYGSALHEVLKSIKPGESLPNGTICYDRGNLDNGGYVDVTTPKMLPHPADWSNAMKTDALMRAQKVTQFGAGWCLPSPKQGEALFTFRHTGNLNGTFNEGHDFPKNGCWLLTPPGDTDPTMVKNAIVQRFDQMYANYCRKTQKVAVRPVKRFIFSFKNMRSAALV